MRVLLKLFPMIVLLALTGCKVNESIHIKAGKSVRGTKQAINGSVHVGSDCEVKGMCRSINGGVRIGSNSRVKAAMAINGGISLAQSVQVFGNVTAVNGGMESGEGTRIKGKVKVVNGGLDMAGTQVMKDVSVHNGNVVLSGGCELMRDLIVKQEKNSSQDITITLKGGSVIHGDVINKSSRRNIELILVDGKVKGRLRGVELVEVNNI